MSSEVFRFVTVHPPQEAASLEAAAATAPTGRSRLVARTIDLGVSATPFTDRLRALRSAGFRVGMVEAAAEFVRSTSFIDSAGKIDAPYREFMAVLRLLPEHDFSKAAGHAFTGIFSTTPSALVNTDAFVAFYARTSDSIVAATINISVAAKVRSLLVEVVRALGLIRRLTVANITRGANVTRGAFVSAPLVLPPGIFPLPVAATDPEGQRSTAAIAQRAKAIVQRQKVAQLTADLTAHREAVDELLVAFERVGIKPMNGSAAPPHKKGFVLAEAAAEQLTGATKNVLHSAGLAAGGIDVVKTVTLLERRTTEIARKLYATKGASPQMSRVGNMIVVRSGHPDQAGELRVVNGAPAPARVTSVSPTSAIAPGLCAPAPPTEFQYLAGHPHPVGPGVLGEQRRTPEPPADTVTVPAGRGDVKVLGIADLMVVEQDLLRYEPGEVARIDNIIQSETCSTTEQAVTTETTGEKPRDLFSAERFELPTESQTVINDDASKSAGLTTHASYGPSVDATPNFNYSPSSPRQQTTSAAASFAREVTMRAAHRIRTRTLTRRTVNVIERSGGDRIVGVYRFVDKVYLAQVVNYGKRLMIEFILPEPAAFLRRTMAHRQLDGMSVIGPEPPGYRANDTFLPLQAGDITRENYLFWASKYGARDVAAPPPSVIVASGAKKSPESLPTLGDRKISSDLMDVAIADGYLCQKAFVNIYGEPQAGDHKIVYQIQDQRRQYVDPVDGNPFLLHLQPTPTLTVTINTLGFHNYEVLITVFCTLVPEKFQTWQLKTFSSIVNAYNKEKSRFAEARRTNPPHNRATEQIELKNGCISLLAGQRSDVFDAYIQAFEQSFEWKNMTYVFYPYFWASKKEWPTLAQLTDDPLFARFVSAGAARVRVPVRRGFEARMLTYLATGELWSGDGTLVNSDGEGPDRLHLSILDELCGQAGDNTVDGAGTITVFRDSADVFGNGTAFTADDVNRRISFGGKTYVIKMVTNAETIKLTTVYTGNDASRIGYSVEGKLIGESWEVKLPTDLVWFGN